MMGRQDDNQQSLFMSISPQDLPGLPPGLIGSIYLLATK